MPSCLVSFSKIWRKKMKSQVVHIRLQNQMKNTFSFLFAFYSLFFSLTSIFNIRRGETAKVGQASSNNTTAYSLLQSLIQTHFAHTAAWPLATHNNDSPTPGSQIEGMSRKQGIGKIGCAAAGKEETPSHSPVHLAFFVSISLHNLCTLLSWSL